MNLLKIDESKCKQDGFCARECPPAIIRLKEKETYPMMLGYPKFKYQRLPERKPPKITWQ